MPTRPRRRPTHDQATPDIAAPPHAHPDEQTSRQEISRFIDDNDAASTRPTTVGDLPVRHGYTIRDLHRITAAALAADRLLAMDWYERRDIAWSAIAEHLCAAPEPPHRQELVRVGWQAIYQVVRDSHRQRGYTDGCDDYASSAPTMPRFVRFWGPNVTPSHEDRIVETVATQQVTATLTNPTYRDAVVALAVHDDYMRAAEALGISYKALVFRLATARRQFLAHWHEGETPYRPRRTDRRVEVHGTDLATHCGAGHEWSTENTRIRHRTVRGRPKHERVCRACERARTAKRAEDAR
jgi:hypothetical protein